MESSSQNVYATEQKKNSEAVEDRENESVSKKRQTNDFETKYIKIKDERGNEVILNIKEMLKAVSVTDEAFEEKLRGPIYEENPEATRFVLCNIEAQHQTKEIYSA